MPSSSRRLSRTTSTVDEEAESEAKPVATFESKNSLTKQTVQDAVEQYMRDRDAREKLFEFGRCVVHFAVDDHEVRFFTHLKDKFSWFLPFNLGWNDGAGNPPNQDGLKTDYLWRRILTRDGLTDILENYAQVVEARDEKTGKKKAVQIWPRLHQLDVVRKLLADAGRHGAGRRYLIQHSNIPWTDADRVHRLITEDIPNRVAADKAYQNARQNSDKQNARIEHDKALARVMTAVLKDDTELFKQFMDNDSFRRWLTDTCFR